MMPSLGEGPETLMADGEIQALLNEKLTAFRRTLEGKDKDLAIFDKRMVAEDPLTLQELGDDSASPASASASSRRGSP